VTCWQQKGCEAVCRWNLFDGQGSKFLAAAAASVKPKETAKKHGMQYFTFIRQRSAFYQSEE